MLNRSIICLTSLQLLTSVSNLLANHSNSDSKYNNYPNKKNLVVGADTFPDKGNNVSFHVDYLQWKTGVNELSFGCLATIGGPTYQENHSYFTFKSPDYDSSAGFRLAADYLFVKEGWNLGLEWTRLSNHSTTTLTNPDANTNLTLVLASDYNGYVASNRNFANPKQTGKWSARFNQFDMDFTKEFFLSKYYSLTPITGLRGVLLKNGIALYNTNTTDPKAYNTVHMNNDYKAFGFKLGLNNSFYLTRTLSLEAMGGAALVYGPKTVSYSAKNYPLNYVSTADQSLRGIEVSQKTHSFVPMIDSGLYINWEDQFFKQKLGFGIKIGYEFHLMAKEFTTIVIPSAETEDDEYVDVFSNEKNNFYMHGVVASASFSF